MIELKLYRHVCNKDIFLARDWDYLRIYPVQDSNDPDTPFYYATRDVMKALNDANSEGFEDWMHYFKDDHMETTLKAKIIDEKDVDICGYTGRLKKELVFPVKEFELVKLGEIDNG